MPVEAHGSLRLDSPGGQALDLVAEGQTLCMDVQRLRQAPAVMPRSLRERRRMLRGLAGTLSIYGLTFSMKSSGKAVLRFGGNTKPSWVARLLRLGPVYLPLSTVFLFLKLRAA